MSVLHKKPPLSAMDYSVSSPHSGNGGAEDMLMCDECQWKPRGVKENLKGYLRKHKNTHKGLRLACDTGDCTKTFSRLDNLKKHKKEKHGIDDTTTTTPMTGVMMSPHAVALLPSKRGHAEDGCVEVADEDVGMANKKRPDTSASDSGSGIRGVSGDYSMLWPALHL
jgi:hypothetical protein